MGIVGFNFNKISIERKGEPKGRVDINNNIAIKDVVPANFGIGKSKEKGVRISYEFSSKYNPDIAYILIAGDVLFIGEENDEILKTWKKDKKMPKEIMQDLLNTIMMRCSVESMILTKDLNLPPPIPFPRLQEGVPDKGKNEYIG